MSIVTRGIVTLVAIWLPAVTWALPGMDFRDCSDENRACLIQYGDFNWPLCGRVEQSDPDWVEDTACPESRWRMVDRYVDPDPKTPDKLEDFISYGFGPRNFEDDDRVVNWHRGIDLEANEGTDVFAAMCGEVVKIASTPFKDDDDNQKYEIEIILRHWRTQDRPDNLSCTNTDDTVPSNFHCTKSTPCIYTRYHHLSATRLCDPTIDDPKDENSCEHVVDNREWVAQGENIGDTGMSETQKYPHLHFELRVPGIIAPDDSDRLYAKDAVNPMWVLPFDENEATAALEPVPASSSGTHSFDFEYVVAANAEAHFHHLKELQVTVWIDGVLYEGHEDSLAEFRPVSFSPIAIPYQRRGYQRFNPDTYNITWTPAPSGNTFDTENQVYMQAPINDGFDDSRQEGRLNQKLNTQYVDPQGVTHPDTFAYRNWNVRPSRDVKDADSMSDTPLKWEWRIRRSVPASAARVCVVAFAHFIGGHVMTLDRLGAGCGAVPATELGSKHRQLPQAVITSAACCGFAGTR